MKDKVLLVFLLCGLCVVPHILAVTHEYYFVNLTLNWPEAQQFCRQHFTDLATITSSEDIKRLNRPGSITGDAWIGLFLTPVFWKQNTDPSTWIWSATGTVSPSGYSNWYYGIGNFGGQCVYVDTNAFWADNNCYAPLAFICYTGSTVKVFYLVTTPLPWFEALEYCRRNNSDLAVLESGSETFQVDNLMNGKTGDAWIGLHREPWVWSDGSISPFTNWTSGRPQGLNGSNCTVEDSAHGWKDVGCDLRLPFFCKNAKRSTVVKIIFSSAGDMSDPRNYEKILQQVEEKLQKTGSSDVSVKWKTPPKKQTSSESKSEFCEKNIP